MPRIPAPLLVQMAALTALLGVTLVLIGMAPAPAPAAPVRPYRPATAAEVAAARLDRLADTLTAQQHPETPAARPEAGPAYVDVAGPAHHAPARRDSASVTSGPAVATTGGPVTPSTPRRHP